MVVLELLHLKMEVTVSEPCDVIRVGKRDNEEPSGSRLPLFPYTWDIQCHCPE